VADYPLNRLVEYLYIRPSAEMLCASVSLCPEANTAVQWRYIYIYIYTSVI